jgi:hypothetical protein
MEYAGIGLGKIAFARLCVSASRYELQNLNVLHTSARAGVRANHLR